MKKIRLKFELIDDSLYAEEAVSAALLRCFSKETREYVKNDVIFEYDSNTTIREMLANICLNSGFAKEKPQSLVCLSGFFSLLYKDCLREFENLDVPLERLLDLLYSDEDHIVLYWTYTMPGGAEVLRKDGLKFIVHTDESVHLGQPHVHVEYSGEVIKIDILTLNITGSFKNKRAIRTAKNVVKEKKEFFLNRWNELVCGLRVPEYIYDEKNNELRE
ncbi:MAG: DUF4160 domain-containing protein [Clostridia bacterium]|nr:DUF4160 domain-containing protein [Clostridia bacterium]